MIAIFFLLLVLGRGELLAQAPYYQGKTITFIVGSGAGTAYYMYSRLLANHIGKHIAGNPTVVVQNMPAAGGMVAANFVYGVAKPDGTAEWVDQANLPLRLGPAARNRVMRFVDVNGDGLRDIYAVPDYHGHTTPFLFTNLGGTFD